MLFWYEVKKTHHFYTKDRIIRRLTQIQICLSQHYSKIAPITIGYILREQHSRIRVEDKYSINNINDLSLKYPQAMKYLEKL